MWVRAIPWGEPRFAWGSDQCHPESVSDNGDRVTYRSRMERARAAAYLRRLADCLESGEAHIQHSERSVGLFPPELVDLEVDADEGGQIQRVGIELSWLARPHARHSLLDISAHPPEAKPVAAERRNEAERPHRPNPSQNGGFQTERASDPGTEALADAIEGVLEGDEDVVETTTEALEDEVELRRRNFSVTRR